MCFPITILIIPVSYRLILSKFHLSIEKSTIAFCLFCIEILSHLGSSHVRFDILLFLLADLIKDFIIWSQFFSKWLLPIDSLCEPDINSKFPRQLRNFPSNSSSYLLSIFIHSQLVRVSHLVESLEKYAQSAHCLIYSSDTISFSLYKIFILP